MKMQRMARQPFRTMVPEFIRGKSIIRKRPGKDHHFSRDESSRCHVINRRIRAACREVCARISAEDADKCQPVGSDAKEFHVKNPSELRFQLLYFPPLLNRA
jgi:hypothetical protein